MTEKIDEKSFPYLKLLPIAYSAAVLWGFIYLRIYYTYFGIDISTYLEIPEILVLMNNDIFDILIHFCIGVIVTITYRLIIISALLKIINPLLKRWNKKKIYSFDFSFYLPLMVAIFFKSIADPGMTLILLPAILSVIMVFSARYKRYRFPRFRNTLFPFTLISIMLLLGSWALASDRAERSRESSKIIKFSFRDTRPSIQTGTSKKYLGRSRNYTFLMDMVTNNSVIIYNSDLKSIEYNVPLSRKEKLLIKHQKNK